jgi:hypothetical protein
MPVSLSDSELQTVMDCSQPLAPKDRDAFLRAVAAELQGDRPGRGASRERRDTAPVPRPAERDGLHPGNSDRFGRLCGFKSDISRGPRSANSGHGPLPQTCENDVPYS